MISSRKIYNQSTFVLQHFLKDKTQRKYITCTCSFLTLNNCCVLSLRSLFNRSICLCKASFSSVNLFCVNYNITLKGFKWRVNFITWLLVSKVTVELRVSVNLSWLDPAHLPVMSQSGSGTRRPEPGPHTSLCWRGQVCQTDHSTPLK